jgi:DNA-binding phage protein
MTIEQIRKQTEGTSRAYIAEQVGLHYHTVRLALTEGTNPSYSTVKLLSDWLEARQS